MTARNRDLIEELNQRGGRTLSLVDLIEAGTLSAKMAGELAALVRSGASFLTGAREGGAGKSTLLAGLLACLPPGEEIVTLLHPGAVKAAARTPAPGRCFLCHEIGSGSWYGYLWGRAAADFIGLARQSRIASCLHADTPEEMKAILLSQSAGETDFAQVGLLPFIRRIGGRRRVTAVYIAGGGAPGAGPETSLASAASGAPGAPHRLRWSWDPARDVFLSHGGPTADPALAGRFARLFEDLQRKGVREFGEVMGRVLRAGGATG